MISSRQEALTLRLAVDQPSRHRKYDEIGITVANTDLGLSCSGRGRSLGRIEPKAFILIAGFSGASGVLVAAAFEGFACPELQVA